MEGEYKITTEITFPNERIAKVVYDVLRVDKEPKRSGVTKRLKLQGSLLQVFFSADLVRQLRVAVTSFYEKLDIVVETVQLFGKPYSFY